MADFNALTNNALNSIKVNPLLSAGLAAGAVGVAGITTAVAIRSRKRKSKKRTSGRSSKRSRSNSRKSRPYKYARTAGKRKDTSKRRIRMTKTGQPYVILASGKARFIKKTSARLSRKRKGGRY